MSVTSPYSCTDQPTFLIKLLLFLSEKQKKSCLSKLIFFSINIACFSLHSLKIRPMRLASCRKDFFFFGGGVVGVVMVSFWKTMWNLSISIKAKFRGSILISELHNRTSGNQKNLNQNQYQHTGNYAIITANYVFLCLAELPFGSPF